MQHTRQRPRRVGLSRPAGAQEQEQPHGSLAVTQPSAGDRHAAHHGLNDPRMTDDFPLQGALDLFGGHDASQPMSIWTSDVVDRPPARRISSRPCEHRAETDSAVHQPGRGEPAFERTPGLFEQDRLETAVGCGGGVVRRARPARGRSRAPTRRPCPRRGARARSPIGRRRRRRSPRGPTAFPETDRPPLGSARPRAVAGPPPAGRRPPDPHRAAAPRRRSRPRARAGVRSHRAAREPVPALFRSVASALLPVPPDPWQNLGGNRSRSS